MKRNNNFNIVIGVPNEPLLQIVFSAIATGDIDNAAKRQTSRFQKSYSGNFSINSVAEGTLQYLTGLRYFDLGSVSSN